MQEKSFVFWRGSSEKWYIFTLTSDINNLQTVQVDSLQNHRVRQIGAEHLGVTFFNKLNLSQCLSECGLTKRQVEIAQLLIIGRLVHHGSERHLYEWAQHISGLDEIIKADFSHLSLNSLYKVSDLLYENKTEIEAHLRAGERNRNDFKTRYQKPENNSNVQI